MARFCECMLDCGRMKKKIMMNEEHTMINEERIWTSFYLWQLPRSIRVGIKQLKHIKTFKCEHKN